MKESPTAKIVKPPHPAMTAFSLLLTAGFSFVWSGMLIFLLSSLLAPGVAVPLGAVLGVGLSGFLAWFDIKKAKRQAMWWGLFVVVASISTVWAWTTPLTTRISQYKMPVNGAYWNINNQRLAYRYFPAQGQKKPFPVVFLHGGPGGYAVQLESVSSYFGELSSLGFDVYVYDQIGAGLSDRLTDPKQYTVARMVADLEQIRLVLNSEKLILIGESWGGTLASSYLAAHPNRVERMVLISPGELDHSKWKDVETVTAKGSPGPELMLSMMTPKMMLYSMIRGNNPDFAKAWIPDLEIDSFMDRFFEKMRGSTVCDPKNVPETSSNGFGAWTLEMTAADNAKRTDNPKAALEKNPTPTLVLKGKCDFLIWDVTKEYRDTLPNAQLVVLPNGGHVLYWEEGENVRKLLHAFLREQPLPIAPYTEDKNPFEN